jgi:lipopolysaccharide biosynthesis glycosyltransferase
LAGAQPVGSYISAVAMGRLIIPRKLTGRVLYLDGDVRVTADVSQLFYNRYAGTAAGRCTRLRCL